MTAYAKIDPQLRIEEAHKKAIDRFLAIGDADNATFRQICYAAVADAFNRFVLAKRSAMSKDQAQAMRQLLVSAIDHAESRFVGQGEPAKASASATSLAADPLPYFSDVTDKTAISTPAKASVPPARRRPSTSYINGALLGASLVLLAAMIAVQSGLVYLHARPAGFAELKALNESVAKAEPEVKRVVAALHEVKTRLLAYRDTPKAGSNRDIATKWLALKMVFPDLEAKFRHQKVRNEPILLRLTPDRKGYKILMRTVLCGPAVIGNPALLDPIRNHGGVFCNYIGVWDEAGRRL